MAYCSECGKKLPENAVLCPYCATAVPKGEESPKNRWNYKEETSENHSHMFFGLISLFVPIVGLIIYVMWKEERPKDAKWAGIGAILGVIFEIAFPILLAILAGIFHFSIFSY